MLSAAVQTAKLRVERERELASSLPSLPTPWHCRAMFDVLDPKATSAERARCSAPVPDAGDGSLDRTAIRSFLRSVAPALDRAFGLDRGGEFPSEIAVLIAQLHAGPLGPARSRRRRALRSANLRRRLRLERLA
jgi:hypothetical protein